MVGTLAINTSFFKKCQGILQMPWQNTRRVGK